MLYIRKLQPLLYNQLESELLIIINSNVQLEDSITRHKQNCFNKSKPKPTSKH